MADEPPPNDDDDLTRQNLNDAAEDLNYKEVMRRRLNDAAEDLADAKLRQMDLFGTGPEEDPTEVTFRRKTEFGSVAIKFTVPPGVGRDGGFAKIDEALDSIVRRLESLHAELKNQTLQKGTTE